MDITEVEAVEPVAVVTDLLSITELFTAKQLVFVDCVAKASSPFPDEAELDAWISLDIDSVVLDGEDLKEE